MDKTMKRNVCLGLVILAVLTVVTAALNCYANANFGRLTLEVLGEDADLSGMKLSVLSAGVVAAVLMAATGWQTWKGGNPRMNFVLALAATLLVTIYTVFCRQQGGNALSRVVNTLDMVCAFLAVTIANRERS